MIAVSLLILKKRMLLSVRPTHHRTLGFEGETLRNAGAGWVCGQASSRVAAQRPELYTQRPEPYTLRPEPYTLAYTLHLNSQNEPNRRKTRLKCRKARVQVGCADKLVAGLWSVNLLLSSLLSLQVLQGP